MKRYSRRRKRIYRGKRKMKTKGIFSMWMEKKGKEKAFRESIRMAERKKQIRVDERLRYAKIRESEIKKAEQSKVNAEKRRILAQKIKAKVWEKTKAGASKVKGWFVKKEEKGGDYDI